jgi:hypothetical protein
VIPGTGPKRVMAVVACAAGISAWFVIPTAGQEPPPHSPCRATARMAVAPKLVCPLESAEVLLVIRTACPEEVEGAASVESIHVALPLPEGIVREDASGGALPSTTSASTWHFERPPSSGITISFGVRALRAGDYALDAGLKVTIEDDRGRVATPQADPGDEQSVLGVSGPCSPGRGASIYLPLVNQPRCTPSVQPADIVLLVDRSGSMGRGGLADAGRQARAFFDGLNLKRDRVAVIAFDQAWDLRAPLGSDRAALERALGSLRLGPGTAIDRAIDAGADHLDAQGLQDRRRILVLLTDGVQTGPRDASFVVAAADAARAQGIAILTVALGPAPNHVLLQRLSSQPAHAINAPDPRDLGQAFRDLAEVAVCTTNAW